MNMKPSEITGPWAGSFEEDKKKLLQNQTYIFLKAFEIPSKM